MQAALLTTVSPCTLELLAGSSRRTVARWMRGAPAPLALLRLLSFTRRGEFAALMGEPWRGYVCDIEAGTIRNADWRAGITGADVLELASLRASAARWQRERAELERRAARPVPARVTSRRRALSPCRS
jgi:hypothetical protein